MRAGCPSDPAVAFPGVQCGAFAGVHGLRPTERGLDRHGCDLAAVRLWEMWMPVLHRGAMHDLGSG